MYDDHFLWLFVDWLKCFFFSVLFRDDDEDDEDEESKDEESPVKVCTYFIVFAVVA